ncbi:kelch domain-containing protein [Reticulomyxa filosa]|uniref:Kelch domain-containing protein n=1 Tax=Reticulomyxa filosa TaxID=46433 RepID=X6P1M3_RETFI|nr:kelch domain-containing protein [Reticulomyxa filosa]|eukprot:ETO31447.1 kelch domain-containing protein [Reticulomyxa filosa]
MRSFCCYGFVYVNDSILFFGGYDGIKNASREVYRYSIVEDQWVKFESILPMPLNCCIATLSGDNKFVHVIGGYNEHETLSTHMKTILQKWTSEIEIEKEWMKKEEEDRHNEEIEKGEKEKKEIKMMNEELSMMGQQQLNIQKLKVKNMCIIQLFSLSTIIT